MQPHGYVRDGAIWIAFQGHEFQLFVGEDERYYLHDPLGHLDFEHVQLPTHVRRVNPRVPGLGASEILKGAKMIVPTALSFVPVVGPALAAVASIAIALTGNMFGGNDPTPMQQLGQDILNLRQAIVNAHTQLGIPDAMPPPLKGYKNSWIGQNVVLEVFPNNKGNFDVNHWTCDFSGVHCSGCGHSRKCMYATINKLAPLAQSLGAKLNAAQEIQSVFGNVGQPGVAPGALPGGLTSSPVASGGGFFPTSDSGGSAPSAATLADITGSAGTTLLPLLLGGAALIIALASKGSGENASKRVRR